MSVEEVRMEANQILMYLGQATITDKEALLLKDDLSVENILNNISAIIQSRGSEGEALEKLNAYALLNGVCLKAKKTFKSNILIGDVLE